MLVDAVSFGTIGEQRAFSPIALPGHVVCR